jgi:hypothetical protein
VVDSNPIGSTIFVRSVTLLLAFAVGTALVAAALDAGFHSGGWPGALRKGIEVSLAQGKADRRNPARGTRSGSEGARQRFPAVDEETGNYLPIRHG